MQKILGSIPSPKERGSGRGRGKRREGGEGSESEREEEGAIEELQLATILYSAYATVCRLQLDFSCLL